MKVQTMNFCTRNIGLWAVAMVMQAGVLCTLQAQTLAKPVGPVVLTVTGLITQRNAGDAAEFDAAMLDALPKSEFTTSSPWHKMPAKFSGPALKTVLDAVGAQGKTLKMVALDKYEITVPVEDAYTRQPVLTRRIDDQLLTVRTKGPLFMMYPFDSSPQLKNDTFYSRSIWQLRRIVVE